MHQGTETQMKKCHLSYKVTFYNDFIRRVFRHIRLTKMISLPTLLHQFMLYLIIIIFVVHKSELPKL